MNKKKIIAAIESLFPQRKLRVFEKYSVGAQDINSNRMLISKKVNLDNIESCMWFLPGISNVKAGGFVTILKLSEYLSFNFKCINYFHVVKRPQKEIIHSITSSYPNLKFEFVEAQDLERIEACSVAICTFWSTAFDLVKFQKCSKKFYLLQDDEREFYSKGSLSELVESTYRFGFKGIANSQEIANRYAAISGFRSYTYSPGLDLDLLPCREVNRPTSTTNIVVYARPSSSRNCFEALVLSVRDAARSLGDNYMFYFVGENFSPTKYYMPHNCIILGHVEDKSKLMDLYSHAHFGISFINTPTITYHQLDLIQAGVCLITNHNTAIRSKFNDDEVYYTYPVYHELYPFLLSTLKDRESCKIRVEKALKRVELYSWDETFKSISQILKEG